MLAAVSGESMSLSSGSVSVSSGSEVEVSGAGMPAVSVTQGTLAGQIDLTFSPRDQERLAAQPTSIAFIARTTSVPPIACTDDSEELSLWLDGAPLDAYPASTQRVLKASG